MTKDEKSDKKEFFIKYEEIKKKYSLPEISEIEEDFDLDKTLEKEKTTILREMRREMMEKITAYMHFFETLINPTNTPMFLLSFIKHINEERRKNIKQIYQELAKLQIKTIKLDTIFNEQNEAQFINELLDKWNSLKKNIYNLIEEFEKEFEKNNIEKEKSYFG